MPKWHCGPARKRADGNEGGLVTVPTSQMLLLLMSPVNTVVCSPCFSRIKNFSLFF